MAQSTNVEAPIVAWTHDGFWHRSTPNNVRERRSLLYIAEMTRRVTIRELSAICMGEGLGGAFYNPDRSTTPSANWEPVRANVLEPPDEAALRKIRERIGLVGLTASSYFGMGGGKFLNGDAGVTLYDIAEHEGAAYPGVMLANGLVICEPGDLPPHDVAVDSLRPRSRDEPSNATPAISRALTFLPDSD